MAKPVNAFLAKRDAAQHERYMRKLQMNTEIDCFAVMRLLHEEFKVGPGRASRLLLEFLSYKMEFANTVLEDSADDKEVIKTKHDYAEFMKSVLGHEGWEENKNLFPFLAEYW